MVFASESAEQKGNQRKTTGSYYTPDNLVQALLDTALDPVLDKTEAQATDPVAALLKLSVIDPACGSGHFLLAAARRIATRVARIRAEGTPSLADFRHALRDVGRNCLHGVDRNPMAVELSKVALWIETVDPGLPLGFFDAQIRCGDALLGVFELKALELGIPDAAYKPLTGDDKEVAKYYAQKNKREQAEKGRVAEGFSFNRARDLQRDFEALRAMPENTVEQIEAKAARLHALTAQGASAWQMETACDLYIAAFLLPKKKGGPHARPDGMPRRGAETMPTSGTLWEWLRGMQPFGPLFGEAIDSARKERTFHWPLEFPHVMQGGGFDVVLGNPPWEVMQLSEEEYFAARKPEIAALAGAARKRAIAALEQDDPAAFTQFAADKRQFEAANEFVRESGRFDLTARGKVNTYSLFAELFANLTHDRAGIIVPTGIATDATTAPFFAALVEGRQLARLVDFENSAPLFPGVHRSFKFCLLTLGRDEDRAHFAFFLTDPAQLAERERNFTLSPGAISRLNPNTRTAPVFRSRTDAELTAKIYASTPVLIEDSKVDEGNLWRVEFRQGLFNMTSDSHLFRTAAQLSSEGFVRAGSDWTRGQERYVPLFESKMFDIYNHRVSDYRARGEDRGHRVLPELSISQLNDPNEDAVPFYWVQINEVEQRCPRRSFLFGYGEATTATTDRTCVVTAFPYAGVGHKTILLFCKGANTKSSAALIANANSLPLDFVARTKVSYLTLAQFIFKQLPIFPPNFYTERRLAFIIPRVLELTYTSYSLAPFARDLGFDGPPFPWDEDRRAQLRADLDTFYARAYSLTRDELRYVLDPADVKGPDYPSETFRVLKEKEIRQHGEYRTQRLVLAAWDRMATNGEFTAMGM